MGGDEATVPARGILNFRRWGGVELDQNVV